MTQAMVFSADDGCDVGEDGGSPVSPDYGPRGNAFNGRVKGVQLAIDVAARKAATAGCGMVGSWHVAALIRRVEYGVLLALLRHGKLRERSPLSARERTWTC